LDALHSARRAEVVSLTAFAPPRAERAPGATLGTHGFI